MKLPSVDSVDFLTGQKLEAAYLALDPELKGSAYCRAVVQAAIDAGIIKGPIESLGFREVMALAVDMSRFFQELVSVPKALSWRQRIARRAAALFRPR